MIEVKIGEIWKVTGQVKLIFPFLKLFSAGVIDQDYRGNVGVVTFNFNDQDFTVNKGDRIAQLILERIYIPDLEELKVQSQESK